MKFNKTTFNLALVTIILFGLYMLIYAGLSGTLLCTAIAFISAAFLDDFELVVASTIIFGLFYIFFLRKFLIRLEPFENIDTPKKIMGRIESMEKKYHPEPQGVYNPAIEGFQDVQPTQKKEGESAQSSSASSIRTEEVNMPNNLKEEVTNAHTESSRNKVNKDEIASATGNVFKLGQLPSENKDGPHVDSGSTLLKAMESFKPEQIASMTSDTKSLIETQKNLMNMLGNMRPILQDGKQLLDTFSGMFGAGSGIKL